MTIVLIKIQLIAIMADIRQADIKILPIIHIFLELFPSAVLQFHHLLPKAHLLLECRHTCKSICQGQLHSKLIKPLIFVVNSAHLFWKGFDEIHKLIWKIYVTLIESNIPLSRRSALSRTDLRVDL